MRTLSEAELLAEGEALGRALAPGSVVCLEGDLGAGKTTFIRGVVSGLGASLPATSPTYALVHRYQGRRGPVYHLDCFRLRDAEEARDLDWEGLLADGDAILVEWPERVRDWIPEPALRYRLHHVMDPALRGLERL
jgi:tRNA threonylcarbamoyladenosine biosynthesis protein TsaE